MFWRKRIQQVAIVASVLVLTSIASTAPRTLTDDDMAARLSNRHGGGSLDQNYNQLRYVKTTDYGASWNISQAGDLGTFAPYDEVALGDFSAVTMNNNELCYLITLLTAATPGVYAIAGPSFTPVLVMAQGSNDFSYSYSGGDGRCDIGRAPDGSLVGIFWGANASTSATLWACKSTDNGVNWNSWVVATEPNIPPVAELDGGYFHASDRVSNQWAWAVFQDPVAAGQFDIRVVRFDHTTTNVGTIVPVDYSGHQYSFMFSGTKPMAYDPVANYLYIVFRNHVPLTGILAFQSDNAGQSFTSAGDISAPGQRYPSISLRTATQTPFVNYGETVAGLNPGDQHCTYLSYDEFGYGGGGWTAMAPYQCVTLIAGSAGFNSIYVPQIWWWDVSNGIGKFDGYTNFLSGEIIQTNRTTDGGVTWTDLGTRMHYVTDQLNGGTMQISEIVGGDNGTAYVVFCGCHGITDEEAPTVANLEWLGTGTPGLGPYPFRAFYDDNVGIDTTNPAINGPWINWGTTPDPGQVQVANWDSIQITNPAHQAGWYYFTVPGGWSAGDSLWIYADGYDLSGNYNSTLQQIIVAGTAYLDVRTPGTGSVTEFKLYDNYPNPFNPETRITFDIASASEVTLTVFNTLGQAVRVLADHQPMNAGQYSLSFNGADLPSGIYLYRLQAGSFFQTRQMVLLK